MIKWKPLEMVARIQTGSIWENDQYRVMRRSLSDETMHLSICRIDKEPCKSWRDFQRIKNELAGKTWEGVELYPSEDRLTDMANQYHIWCFKNGLKEIGFQSGRMVTDEKFMANTKQEPIPEDWEKTPRQTILDELKKAGL